MALALAIMPGPLARKISVAALAIMPGPLARKISVAALAIMPGPLARKISVAALAIMLGAVVLSGGCATTKAGIVKPDAQLVVDAAVHDARVYVDDVFAGRAAELRGRALLVRSGTRRVEIRADGYFTAYRDVTILPGARALLTIALHAAPPNEPAE